MASKKVNAEHGGGLSQRRMARALGLSAARINGLSRLGMPMHSADAAKRWRDENVAPRMPRMQPQRRAATPEPSLYLDGVDDGWAAALQAMQDFAILYGIERFGPALVGMIEAMPLEALGQASPNPAIDDVWQQLEAEHALLVASGA